MTTKLNLMARIGQAQATQAAIVARLRYEKGGDPSLLSDRQVNLERAAAYSFALSAVISASEGNSGCLEKLCELTK